MQVRLVGPTLIIGVLSALVLFLFLVTLSARADDDARAREQRLIANGVAGRLEELERAFAPRGAWRRADLEAFWRARRYEAGFALDGADRPLFARIDGADAPAGAFSRFARAAAPLMAQVRAQEMARGAGTPVQASGIGAANGRLYALVVTLGRLEGHPQGAARASLVVTGEAIDASFLKLLEQRFLVRDLRLAPGDHRVASKEAHVALRTQAGVVVATLHWLPERPGSLVLEQAILPVVLVLLGLIGLAYLLFRDSRHMAHSLIASEARAIHMAQHDALTGLPNRLFFADRLAHALERARRSGGEVAVMCIDLDRFKEVNDTLGHHCGDELIREAARRLARTCRASDSFARLSGDEFAIVQCDATAHSAAVLARRVVETLSGPVELPAGRAYLGCSVGVTVVANADTDAAEALRQADLALYRAKERGRAQYCFFEVEMDAALRARRALEQDLREALAGAALQMAYQPQVNARGQVTGVEALARWNHPRRGAVSPALFVPVAEECGLIEALGMFTLKRAFEDSRRWPALRIGVNISAYQLRMRDFVEQVVALTYETGVDPRRIELEITEGVLLGDDPDTHATLQRLRSLGFALVLDDFGTGYSSLSYLRRFPVTKIKIDRSFVASLGVDGEADAVVGAIVKLARALSLGVIAEGVETTAQRKRLLNAGCEEFQGFLTGRPATAAEIDVLHAKTPEATPAV